ncbi:acyl-CoA synthetase family protein [Halorussus halobius]|uniref:AMP-binding protein n=1 Tax=Halorussus halobius TaxID=1710537 RepID=UPI001093059D|nr:AMP-binding protein [Halorussus halobius]
MDAPDADALGDLVARNRRSDDPALVAARTNRRYDYRRFCTTAWKTGNFWRRLGVHRGTAVAVAADPVPEPVFALFGAALLGARTEFGLPESAATLDARLAVAAREAVADYELPPGGRRVAYGGPPDDPGVAHFERDVWSENPAFPDASVDPDSVALAAGDRAFSHADLLSGARRVADEWALEPGDEVAVRASLADPGAVVAGVLAPLLAGATVLLPGDDATGDVAVVGEGRADAPESRTLAAAEFP